MKAIDDPISSSDDPDRVMFQIQSSDVYLDQEMIQIERCSRSSEDDLKMKKTQDADDEMIQLIQRRRLVLINCVDRIPS